MAGSMIKRVKSLISEKWRVVEPWSGQVKILTKLEKLSKMGSDWGQ
jgi:hypothetical protein